MCFDDAGGVMIESIKVHVIRLESAGDDVAA